MSAGVNLGAIERGMPVYGPGGEPLGPVEMIDTSGIRVQNHTVPSVAISRIDNDGVHLHLALTAFHVAPPMLDGATQAAGVMAEATTDVATDGVTEARYSVPVAEERLVVGTRQMQVGEVTIDKRVVEEQIMVPVTVRREEIEIIRRAPGEPREEIDDPTIVEIIRIPLHGEEPVITTRQVVTSEVIINRTVQSEQQVVTRTVRSTDVSIEERFHEAYAQSRPAFEEHFAHRQRTQSESGNATSRARTFSDAESNYRAGFIAGHDGRYVGQTYEEIEPQLSLSNEPAEHDPGMLEQIREEVRAGFARARTMGAR